MTLRMHISYITDFIHKLITVNKTVRINATIFTNSVYNMKEHIVTGFHKSKACTAICFVGHCGGLYLIPRF